MKIISDRSTIIHGKMEEKLSAMPENSFPACVTDPPYGFSFMNHHWDYEVPSVEQWKQVYRVLMPGAFLLSFGGSRTYHRVACNIEDAGFEIRDQLMWIYGSGFPKSLNLPGGIGTALKPAREPIVLARKPLIGTVEENYMIYGTGVLNIDRCRIDTDSDLQRPGRKGLGSVGGWSGYIQPEGIDRASNGLGRWPANLIHDGSDEVLAHFPESKGQLADKNIATLKEDQGNQIYSALKNKGFEKRGDEGSAARFFYCAKASKADRNEGVEHLPPVETGHNRFDQCGNCGGYIFQNQNRPSACKCELPVRKNNTLNGNNHPTVKPTPLMRYLCRLITPPGGTVLDPFAGSGSTGKGAIQEGFKAVLIEQNIEYIPIIEGRVKHAESEIAEHVAKYAPAHEIPVTKKGEIKLF